MGYSIDADASAGAMPYPIHIIVECDGEHGFFDPPKARFEVGPNKHPRDPAVASGWTFNPDGPVYCPECS